MSLSILQSNRKHFVNKPFERLPIKQRAVFILHLAGFTQREVSKLLKTSLRDINTYISRGYKEYGE